MDNKEMIYFNSGELVELKQKLSNKPVMVVKNAIKSRIITTDKKASFLGIKCFWFTDNMEYQEQMFNSKDLQKC